MAKESNDNKKSLQKEELTVKKPMIKNKTLIIMIIVISVLIAIGLFVMNFVKGRSDSDEIGEASKREWQKIADNISYMIASSDIQIKYRNTDKRTVLELIGSDGYYYIQYSGNNIYFASNKYTSTADTDEAKITEAQSNITKGLKIFAGDVTSFSVDNYDAAKDAFTGETADISFGINRDINVRNTVSVPLPKK